MIKRITIISILLILILCTACNQGASSPTSGTQNASPFATTDAIGTTTETTPLLIYNAPLAAVSMPIYTDYHYNKDGTVLFTYSKQDLTLIINDPLVAEKIFTDYLNRTDFENSTARKVLQSATSDYNGQPNWIPYTYSILYSPVRLDQTILSLYGTESSYTGSLRGTASNTSVTYDLLSGNALTLKEVLLTSYSAEQLCELIFEALQDLDREGLLFSNYKNTITDMFNTNTPVDCWYLTSSGLCFYFSPYEIAPYSTGTVFAEIPYEKLNGLLRDAYFPAEQVDFKGSLFVTPFDESNTLQYTQFAEIVLDNSENKMLLSTDGTLLAFRIETGVWSDDGLSFTPENTIFSAEAITANCPLIVQGDPAAVSNLRLVFKVNGEYISCRLAN